jgi:hypothetical protein
MYVTERMNNLIVNEDYLVEASARKWWESSGGSHQEDKLLVLLAAKVIKKDAEKFAKYDTWAKLPKVIKKDIVQGLRNLRWAPEKRNWFTP